VTAKESANLQVRLRPEQRQVPAVTSQRSFGKTECRLLPGSVLKKIYACIFVRLHPECGCNRAFAVADAVIRLLVERLELDR